MHASWQASSWGRLGQAGGGWASDPKVAPGLSTPLTPSMMLVRRTYSLSRRGFSACQAGEARGGEGRVAR